MQLWCYCAPYSQSSVLAPLVRQLTLAARIDAGDADHLKMEKLRSILPENDDCDAVPLLADLLSTAGRHARFWELRAAAALARLLVQDGDDAQAREIVKPVCEWFTEGLETEHLRTARALLADSDDQT